MSDSDPGAPAPIEVFASRMASAAVLAYFVGLVLVVAGMELGGERLWPMAVLLYLPQQILLLPLIVLVPTALLAEVPGRIWALMAGCVIVYLWHVPFYTGWRSRSDPQGMKVMTNNYAQNHGLPLKPWIDEADPDIVAIEDARGRGGSFKHEFPQRYVDQEDQFIFISKTPIHSAALVPAPFWRGAAVAAVCDVTWNGRDVAVYAIHMPTPRGDFARLRGLGIVREILGRNSARSDGLSFQQAMTARVQLAGDLADVIAAEKRPYVLMGDFNMPSNGYVHGVFANRFADCFAAAGRGFGFTFPGDARNPIALFQPWLRLDCVFAGPGWRVDQCEVEPSRRSKHRAVMAVLTPA
ncbi:MAG: endonuclease/exonuclease/phosphatase family protein [Chthoniobacteraceae bacterium]|jgi:endonuclease/exonuclease/phosphatase family metal-dependent hydrolase